MELFEPVVEQIVVAVEQEEGVAGAKKCHWLFADLGWKRIANSFLLFFLLDILLFRFETIRNMLLDIIPWSYDIN